MATEVRHIIAASGGDYTSLAAWAAAQARNLVAADQIAVAECRDFADSGNLPVTSAWTTDATRYIRVEVPPAYRHDGTPRAVSGRGFRVNGAGLQAGHIQIVGAELYGTGATPGVTMEGTFQSLLLDSCLVHDEATGTGYTISGSSGTFVMRNTFVWGSRRTIDTRTMTSAEISNCTAWRHADQHGIVAGSSTVIKNTYCGKASGTSDDFWSGGTPTGNNNASSDTTAQARFTSSLNSISGGGVFVSVTSGSENFHLKTGTNNLVGAGANLTAAVTTGDIDGSVRPSSGAWDIGADWRDSGDSTAPTLTSPSGTGGALVCSGSVSTNEANGTLYAVATASATAPTGVQVEAGQDHTGAAALRAANVAVSATGTVSIGSGAVTAGTRYMHFMHKDAAGNRSAVASSASFVVSASGPTINTQPSGQSAVAPATATFTVAATASAGTLSYQWQRQPAAGGGYSDISGANSASYTTPATTVSGGSANNGDLYRAVVTDSNGSTTSSAATLTVTSLAGVTLTSSVLKNNTGTVLAGVQFTAFVNDKVSGSYVVKKTGIVANGSGVVAFSDAALTSGVTYRVAWQREDSGQEGLETLTAV